MYQVDGWVNARPTDDGAAMDPYAESLERSPLRTFERRRRTVSQAQIHLLNPGMTPKFFFKAV